MRPIGCPETSIRNCDYSLLNSPEECRSKHAQRIKLSNFVFLPLPPHPRLARMVQFSCLLQVQTFVVTAVSGSHTCVHCAVLTLSSNTVLPNFDLLNFGLPVSIIPYCCHRMSTQLQLEKHIYLYETLHSHLHLNTYYFMEGQAGEA